MKFEEAFCKTKHQMYSVDEIASIHEECPEEYSSTYKEHLFCPECLVASLVFVNAVIPYFRSSPKTIHLENCTLNQAELSQKQIDKIMNDNRSKEKIIKHQLENTLGLLLNNKISNSSTRDSNPVKVIGNRGRHKEYRGAQKRIPQKRIDLPLREDDFDCVKIFYGSVYLRWEPIESSPKYIGKFLLTSPKSNKLLCRLLITRNVYENFMKNEKTLNWISVNARLSRVAFLANFSSQKNKMNTYLTTSLMDSRFLTILQ